MITETTRSKEMYERALRVLPGGVSRNAVLCRPHPTYAFKGEGCHVTDIDGNRRIDFANNVASLIHGHAHPAVIEAVTKQLQLGTAFNLTSEVEVEYAELLCDRSDAFDMIRFVNSGTEAIMCCLKAARAYTQRPKIAKIEGSYHGLYDYAEVSQTANPDNWGMPDNPASVPVSRGTPSAALNDVVIIPFNNPELALSILDRHADQLACVLLDPLPHRVGLVPASGEFVKALRDWTRRNESLLVFDEVITYRSEFGGAQEWYEDKPDLTAIGKIIGGGFPVGAITGSRHVMEVLNPLADKVLFPHSGTFSANPITMTAGLKTMELFDRDAVARLNDLADVAREKIAHVIERVNVPCCVTGAGSIFRIHMKPSPPTNYRDAFVTAEETRRMKDLLDFTFKNGIMLINTCSGTLSTPMTEEEIDTLCDVLEEGLRQVFA
ncbi:MAG: aspartate aminotransferase family protein [Candidatus Sumerlaeia bacterium]|nr:aspartate aminotransferase family protein [Candidatus Sumerlaeia bacterium]